MEADALKNEIEDLVADMIQNDTLWYVEYEIRQWFRYLALA